MIMSSKEWEIKFEPRIKLNHNITQIKASAWYVLHDRNVGSDALHK